MSIYNLISAFVGPCFGFAASGFVAWCIGWRAAKVKLCDELDLHLMVITTNYSKHAPHYQQLWREGLPLTTQARQMPMSGLVQQPERLQDRSNVRTVAGFPSGFPRSSFVAQLPKQVLTAQARQGQQVPRQTFVGADTYLWGKE